MGRGQHKPRSASLKILDRRLTSSEGLIRIMKFELLVVEP